MPNLDALQGDWDMTGMLLGKPVKYLQQTPHGSGNVGLCHRRTTGLIRNSARSRLLP